jgi:hypothetical protein
MFDHSTEYTRNWDRSVLLLLQMQPQPPPTI